MADYEQTLEQTVVLGEMLPPAHLERFVVDLIAQLDLSSFYAHYEVRGGNENASQILLDWGDVGPNSAVHETDGCAQAGQHQLGRDEDPRRRLQRQSGELLTINHNPMRCDVGCANEIHL